MDKHPARGKIDLSWHKMAGLYRAPATKTRRHAIRKPRGEMHRQIWRLVDGAVRDAFANHPDYLTPLGQQRVAQAVTKRVTGSLMGYAMQVARGRSAKVETRSIAAAAEETAPSLTGVRSWRQYSESAVVKARAVWARAWAGRIAASPKFGGDPHG